MDYITNATVLTTENQRKMIFSLKKAFPSMDCRLIGHSLCSRGIFSLGIGRSSDPLLIAAGFHGQEWLTCLAALRFAELLLRSRAAGKKLCGIDTRCITREVIIVPCVNPDGVQIAINGCDGAGRYSAEVSRICAASDEKWNANARGVDINHNFDAGWDILRELEIDSGILGPAPRRYGGYMAESEPETAALVALCRVRQPRMAIALHSQGEEIYWRYGDRQPPASERIARILAASSGYRLVENDGLASHGGFKDWFIEYFDRPAFTVEMGKGENPLPVGDLDRILCQIVPMLTLAAIM